MKKHLYIENAHNYLWSLFKITAVGSDSNIYRKRIFRLRIKSVLFLKATVGCLVVCSLIKNCRLRERSRLIE